MITMDKTYRTNDGDEVDLWKIEGGFVYGRYKCNGAWYVFRTGVNTPFLVEVKPRIKRTEWVNYYPHDSDLSSAAYTTREIADLRSLSTRIACIKREVEFEEGEGL